MAIKNLKERVIRLSNVRDLIMNVQTGRIAGWDYTNEQPVYVVGEYSSHKTLFIVKHECDCYADGMTWLEDRR